MPKNAFPYPGNKARHSEWIISHLPEHECYVEPFGGAAGVLFNKPRSKVEVYNDLDGDIVHFFEVLRDRPGELQAWLERVPYARQLHEEWATAYYDGFRPDDDIERAGRWFFLRYSQFGSKSVAKDAFATGKTAGGRTTGCFAQKVNRLNTFAERLRKVVVENESFKSVINRYDSERAVFYCDPPYIGSEHRYSDSSIDHRKLHDILTNCDADILVSYDAVPPFYGDGWQVDTKSSSFAIDSNNGGHKDATEVLLMNFDADGEPLMSEVGQQTMDAFGD